MIKLKSCPLCGGDVEIVTDNEGEEMEKCLLCVYHRYINGFKPITKHAPDSVLYSRSGISRPEDADRRNRS